MAIIRNFCSYHIRRGHLHSCVAGSSQWVIYINIPLPLCISNHTYLLLQVYIKTCSFGFKYVIRYNPLLDPVMKSHQPGTDTPPRRIVLDGTAGVAVICRDLRPINLPLENPTETTAILVAFLMFNKSQAVHNTRTHKHWIDIRCLVNARIYEPHFTHSTTSVSLSPTPTI